MSEIIGILGATLQQGADAIVVRPRRSIGAFTAYVVLKEAHHDELQITDHPLEKGTQISDHAFKRPAEVTIEFAYSNSPVRASLIDGVVGGVRSTLGGVQAILSGNASSQVRDIYQKLVTLQESAILFDVFTGKRKYQNMLIRALSTTTDKTTENSLVVTAICRQVFVVSTQTLKLSAEAAAQLNPELTNPTANSGQRYLQGGVNYSNEGRGRGFVQ